MFVEDTVQFQVALDFDEMLPFGLNSDESVKRSLLKGYIGKNFQGYFLRELISIDDIGKALINTNILNLTVRVKFTAKCIRLKPNRVIATPVVKYINDKKAIVGSVSIDDDSVIYITYNCKMSEVLVGCYTPAIITEVTYPPYSNKIMAGGDILFPYNKPVYYRHDGSADSIDKVQKNNVSVSGADSVLQKLIGGVFAYRGMSDIKGIKETNNYQTNKLYAVFSPAGPVYEVSEEISNIDYEVAFNSALITNIHEIKDRANDVYNCLVTLSDLYAAPGNVNESKIKPWVSIAVKSKSVN